MVYWSLEEQNRHLVDVEEIIDRLYGGDVTDPELKEKTKRHRKRVILALLGDIAKPEKNRFPMTEIESIEGMASIVTGAASGIGRSLAIDSARKRAEETNS